MDSNEFAEFIASIADTTKDSGKLNAASLQALIDAWKKVTEEIEESNKYEVELL